MESRQGAGGGPTFGELVRRYRIAAHLTQIELSRRSGLSVQAIGMLERGTRRLPRRSTVALLGRALRLGPSQTEALVAASVRVAAGPAPADLAPEDEATAAATRSLPRDVATFTGRKEELDRLLAAVSEIARSRSAVAISAIDGMAGVGKTAFAIHAAHWLASEFPDGQLFLDLHGHTAGQRPVTPEDALGALLLATGLAPHLIPADLDARAALWRDRLSGKRMLILLDDAAGNQQVRPLLPGASASACLVLVTSRRRLAALEDVRPLTLGTLPPAEAGEMFSRLAGGMARDPGSPDVAELVALCGHLPLAIGLLAARLRSHPSWTVRHLTDRVRDERERLAEMRVENVAVEVAFELSYRDLSADQQRLFRRLGIHPGREIDARATAALDSVDLAHARRGLEALYADHLVDEPIAGRYRMHDLIRAYARTLAGQDDHHDREAAIDRILDYYLHVAAAASRHIERGGEPTVPPPIPPPAEAPDLCGRQEALTWLEVERGNLSACFDYAAAHRRPDRAVQIAHAMHPYLRVAGQWHQALAIHRAALAAARLTGDLLGQANALHDRGHAERLIGDYGPAAESLTSALALYREHGDVAGQVAVLTQLGIVQYLTGEITAATASLAAALALSGEAGDRLGRANVLIRLGIVHHLTADYPAATAALSEALGLCQDLDDRPLQATAHGNLGRVLYMTGSYPAATASLMEAQRITRELGDRPGQATASLNLGVVQCLTGDYPAATASLTGALAQLRELGDRYGQANAINDLGAVQRLTGKYEAAAASSTEALALFRDIGDRYGQADALNNLSLLQRVTGQYQAAAASLAESLAISRDIGSRYCQASALQNLGAVQRLTGERALAARSLTDSLALFQDIGDRLGQADVLNGLGALEHDSGGHVEAQAYYGRALDLARDLGAPLMEGRALEGIGRCRALAGDPAGGAVHLRAALSIYQRLGVPEAVEVRAALGDLERPLEPPAGE